MSNCKTRPIFSFLIVLNLYMAVSLNCWADEKPLAPEAIDGVIVVSAEEAIELILSDPDMPIIDSKKKQGQPHLIHMRCINEPIARLANREDHCTGRFWEGRFKS